MNKLAFICIMCLSLVCSHTVSAQQDMGNLDDIYGLNPELYNGRIYSDFYDSHVKGHPFLLNPKYVIGTLRINNKSYVEQLINYDVFKQKVILSFTNNIHTQQLIEIPIFNLQSFSLEDKDFRLIKMPDSTLRIFQVIGKNHNLILIHWTKRMNTTSTASTYDYQFTSAKKQLWILKNHQLYPLKKNKSLIKLFEKEQAADLKKWLNSRRIRIQKANDQQLLYVSEYLNSL